MKNNLIKQIVSFGLVGILNTIVSQIVYMICVGVGLHYIAANVIGFIISVFHAYLWQTKLVFKEDENLEKRVWWQVLLKTFAAYAFTGLVLNNVFLVLWIDVIRIERFTPAITELVNRFGVQIENRDLAVTIAPLLNIVINVPINFVINKFWAYRQKNLTPPSP